MGATRLKLDAAIRNTFLNYIPEALLSRLTKTSIFPPPKQWVSEYPDTTTVLGFTTAAYGSGFG